MIKYVFKDRPLGINNGRRPARSKRSAKSLDYDQASDARTVLQFKNHATTPLATANRTISTVILNGAIALAASEKYRLQDQSAEWLSCTRHCRKSQAAKSERQLPAFISLIERHGSRLSHRSAKCMDSATLQAHRLEDKLNPIWLSTSDGWRSFMTFATQSEKRAD